MTDLSHFAMPDGRRIAHVEEHLREHLAVRGLSAAHAHCTIGDEGLSIPMPREPERAYL